MSEKIETDNYLASRMDSVKIEKMLGLIRSIKHDAGRIYAQIEDHIKADDPSRFYALNNLDLLQELADNSIEDYEEAMAEFGYVVDDSGDYPVLMRANAKPFEWVHVSTIETNKIVLNKRALDMAELIKVKMPMPPLRLMEKVNKTGTKYKLRKGEYCFVGFKINEIEWVPVQIHSEFTGIVNKTGKQNNF